MTLANTKRKDFIDIKGIQWMLIGTCDGLGLYEYISYSGSCYGSKSWAVDFGDGRLVKFADRPSIPALIRKEYPVPADISRKTWKKYEI